MGAEVVISRPADGMAVVLSPITVIIWNALDDWTTEVEVGTVLAERFPDVSEAERRDAVATALSMLTAEGLLERAEP